MAVQTRGRISMHRNSLIIGSRYCNRHWYADRAQETAPHPRMCGIGRHGTGPRNCGSRRSRRCRDGTRSRHRRAEGEIIAVLTSPVVMAAHAHAIIVWVKITEMLYTLQMVQTTSRITEGTDR